MTLVDLMAEAAAGPDDWGRATPRARGEYRRMVKRALRVLAEHRGEHPVSSVVACALAEDLAHG